MTALLYAGSGALGVLLAIAVLVWMAGRKAKSDLRLEMERDAVEAERRAGEVLAQPRSRERTSDRMRRGTF